MAMNKGLTFRMGQSTSTAGPTTCSHGSRRADRSVLRRSPTRGRSRTAPRCTRTFRDKQDSCIKVVLKPALSFFKRCQICHSFFPKLPKLSGSSGEPAGDRDRAESTQARRPRRVRILGWASFGLRAVELFAPRASYSCSGWGCEGRQRASSVPLFHARLPPGVLCLSTNNDVGAILSRGGRRASTSLTARKRLS